MKIIDVGVCVNNNDPQGIGRIRYKPYGSFSSEIEKSIPYEEWDENDQFIATPFLPPHINVIPQVQQSIKLIKYDTSKDTQNVEYVVGPFSSPHDFGSETFRTQHKYTTYGANIPIAKPSVRDKVTGNYINKKSLGSLPNLNDTGISGNYGSDVIFTENGIMIRGGKLLSKDIQNKTLRQKIQDVPMLSDKMAKITLKKFPKKMEMVTETQEVESIVVSKINYIVEYELDSLSSPTSVKFYIYKVINGYGQKYDTNFFNYTTDTLPEEIKSINTGNTITGITAVVTGSTLNALYSETRGFLQTIHNNSLYDINPKYSKDDIHPFYFRPTSEFRVLKPANSSEETIKTNFLNQVILHRSGPIYGLYFSKTAQNPPIKITPLEIQNVKVVNKNEEQTFASTTSDFIYLISTTANKGEEKSVDFTKLDKYEYTQDNFLLDITPSTYALVRGETLIRLLNLMYKFLTEHKHNINDIPLYKEEIKIELETMINSMESTLINQKIRIN